MKQRFGKSGKCNPAGDVCEYLGMAWCDLIPVRRGQDRESAGTGGHFLSCRLAGRTVWVCGGLLMTSLGESKLQLSSKTDQMP